VSDDFNRLLAAQQIGEAFQCPADWAKVFRVQELWTFSGGEDMLGLSAADQIVWDKIMNDENSRIAFDCVDLIGASGGAPTNFVCFDSMPPYLSCTAIRSANTRRSEFIKMARYT
jgi:hypothetical protein